MISTADSTKSNTTAIAHTQNIPVRFMQEDNGNYSSMRLMSLLALLSAIIFGGITLAYSEKVKDVGIELTIVFLVAAYAPKTVQKFAEK